MTLTIGVSYGQAAEKGRTRGGGSIQAQGQTKRRKNSGQVSCYYLRISMMQTPCRTVHRLRQSSWDKSRIAVGGRETDLQVTLHALSRRL